MFLEARGCRLQCEFLCPGPNNCDLRGVFIRFVISDSVLVHFVMNPCLIMLKEALSEAGYSDLDDAFVV